MAEQNSGAGKLHTPFRHPRIFDLVTGRTDIISLGVGEPDFVTPWNIREAAIYSLEKGHTSYTSNYGLESLRRSIVKYVDGFSMSTTIPCVKCW